MPPILPALGLAAALGCMPEVAAQRYEPDGDIGTYQVPQDGVRSESRNEDVMGVIAGKHIRTDCSANVVKGGKTYRVPAAASQTIFEYAPDTTLAKAQDAWDRMTADEKADAPSQ